MPNLFVPTVVQPSPRGDRAFDIYSRLLEERIIFLGTELDADVANLIIAQFLHLEADAATKDIRLYVNSPGGDMNALFGVYDTMQCIRPDVSTVCIGQAASAAAVLLAGGAAGKRYALPNARVLIHQPWGGVQGQSSDIERAVSEMVLQRERMVEILARHTGQTSEQIATDIDRDFILRGDAAVAYGLVDHVLGPPADIEPASAISAPR
jgi:ATP-dependent Clp protease protease subunit